jgi:maltose-binding protein MalE
MLRRKPVFDRLSLQFILYEEEINMKKLLVTLLAASMCLSMFVGCGSKEEETTTTDKETTTSEATTETETEESEVAGDVEMQEFTILGDYTVNASYYQMDQFEDFYSVIAFRELMEANGLDIKFELINDDQYITTLQTRFAAMNNVPYFVAMNGLSENEVIWSEELTIWSSSDGVHCSWF